MADGCFGQPYEAPCIVDAEPQPAATGHLVLPLLQGLAVDNPGVQSAFQRMLMRVAFTRTRCDPFPGDACVGQRGGTDAFPS